MVENFSWEANLCDGTVITQFNFGKETSFKEVQNNSDKLTSFCISNGSVDYWVDLIDGHFELDGKVKAFFDSEPVEKLRLIFFKRRTDTFPSTGIKTVYWIGWQTTVGGKNIKKMVGVDEDNSFVLEEF